MEEIKEKMAHTGSYRERMALLKGAFNGSTAYVVACGPSVRQYLPEDLDHAFRDGVVISVKQAQAILPFATDFHLTNVVNLQKYEYPRSTITIHQSDGRSDHLGEIGFDTHMNSDILVYFNQSTFTVPQQLVFTGRFDEYLFENTLLRPWGPGIIYEIALYLVIHLGSSLLPTHFIFSRCIKRAISGLGSDKRLQSFLGEKIANYRAPTERDLCQFRWGVWSQRGRSPQRI